MTQTTNEPRYQIRTWDSELQEFTPQSGMSVPWHNLTLYQLRLAMRDLQEAGYSCHRYQGGDNDASVLIERIDDASSLGSAVHPQEQVCGSAVDCGGS